MHARLPPVLDKPVYSETLTPEIKGWFWDVIFAPIFDELRAAGVELKTADQAISKDELGRRKLSRDERTNATDMVPFPPEMGSLGIPRSQMPQIPSTARGALVRFLSSRGITNREAWILPGVLRPTQECYSPELVKKAGAADLGDRSILISKEGRILDGHHQWMAALEYEPDEPIRAIRFNAGILDLLKLACQLPSSERSNATSAEAIRAALLSGRIWYADGAFGSDGPFGAEIVRELRALGASFDRLTKLYIISANEIPIDLRGAISTAQEEAAAAHRAIIESLTIASDHLPISAVSLPIGRIGDQIVMDLERQFQAKVPKAVEAVTVAPQLPASVRERLTKTLTENLELRVKGFAAEEVIELRKMTEANLMAGSRLDRLAGMIEARWGVAQRKALFLASQETGLLTAAFRKERAMNAGSTRYIWQTMKDPRVRHDHQELEGKTFLWIDPPLIDQARNRHGHPGEDYGCRCWGIPLIDLPKLKEDVA